MFVRKTRASIPFFVSAALAFVAVSALSACQQSQQDIQARDAKEARASIAVVPSDAERGLANSADAGEVVVAKEIVGISTPTTFSVKYHQGQNAICTLEISEGGKVAAENHNMIECGSLSSPSMVELEIVGDAGKVTLFQQKEKQNNTYYLRRDHAGQWVVTKVVFVYPQDNPQTGDVDVIRETGDLAPPIPVSEYDRKIVEKSLFKSTLQ